MFNKILLPIHQSREAQAATKLVIELVQQYKSQVVLLAVTDTSVVDAAVVGEADEITPEDVGLLLSEVQAVLAQHGIQAEVLHREGKPAFTICDVADEINADLITMGSRGIGLDEERATESVTNRVISLSPCPVLVVP